jgi:MSHA biogenesis protein MshJ
MVRAGDASRHPDQAAIDTLQQQIDAADRALAARQSTLIAPERLPELLKDILSRSKAVELQSLRVLPGVPVRAGSSDTGLYRHGVELSLKGRYFDLVRYLEELEKRGPVLLWGTVELEVEQYPEVRLRAVIQSLSRNASLLSI